MLLATKLPAEHPRGSFEPVFWNRQWFPTQARQTLGLLCDPRHPALARFPTAFHSDFEWEDIINNSQAVNMDTLPSKLRPIVQVIDDWNTNRKLGLVFECRAGKASCWCVRLTWRRISSNARQRGSSSPACCLTWAAETLTRRFRSSRPSWCSSLAGSSPPSWRRSEPRSPPTVKTANTPMLR